jgi:hypothetical protein
MERPKPINESNVTELRDGQHSKDKDHIEDLIEYVIVISSCRVHVIGARDPTRSTVSTTHNLTTDMTNVSRVRGFWVKVSQLPNENLA